MLDIKFIKENKDLVKKAIIDKKTEEVDLDYLLDLYEKRKQIRLKIDEINSLRNKAAKEQNHEQGKILKEQSVEIEKELPDIEKEFVKLLAKIPNLPSADTPVGDESANLILRKSGEPTQFSFEPKAHWDIGMALDIIDSEKAAEISGSRFTYIKGDLVLMQFALMQFAFKTLGDREILKKIADDLNLDIIVTPFKPVLPPVFVRSAVMNRMARLYPIEERYFFEKDDLVLVGSAEHTIGPMLMDQVIEEKDLPIRYIGYSTAFRREAGAAGKDTRGILRQHQFDKIELETFVVPEKSMDEQNFIVGIQEYLMTQLGLPYQVVLKSTGDQGTPNHRGIDIETWMPGQNTYRETHTSDLMTSYQSRRLNTRVKRTDGKTDYVHMNDATVFAMGRTLIAIIENYQEADGSIRIPDVLQPYMGGQQVISKK